MHKHSTATADDGPPPWPHGKRPLAPPPQEHVAGTYTLQDDGILSGDRLRLRILPAPGPGKPATLQWMAPYGWEHLSGLWPRKGWHRIDDGIRWWRVTTTPTGIIIDGPHVMHRTRTAMPTWSKPTSTLAPRQGGTDNSNVPPVSKFETRTDQPTLFDHLP